MTNNEIYEEDKEAEPKYVDVSNTEANIRFCGMMTTIVLGFSILTLIAVVLSNIMINSKLDQSQKDMVEISKGISMLGSDISDLKAILYYVTPDPIYDPEVSPADPTPTPNSCTDDEFEYMDEKKPVIYLYSEEDNVPVQVKLTLKDSVISTTWPIPVQTDNTFVWDVFASKDGTILDAQGNAYPCLFWEATNNEEHSFEKGFCVKGEEVGNFLWDTLREIGLTDEESAEFIIYWLPLMEKNSYNLITFEGLDEQDGYNRKYPLSVTYGDGKAADSILRVNMVWKAADTEEKIEPQTFDTFERKGFTVVEWGGIRIK